MTSNEHKILKYLWNATGTAPVKAVAQNIGFTEDYTRFICHSLERTGYLAFPDARACRLLLKGRDHLNSSGESRSETASVDSVSAVMFPEKKTKDSAKGGSARPVAGGKKKVKKIFEAAAQHPPTIAPANQPPKEAKKKTGLDALKNVTPREKEKLVAAGYKSVQDIAETPITRFIQGMGIRLDRAARWINQARRQTGLIDDKSQKNKKK